MDQSLTGNAVPRRAAKPSAPSARLERLSAIIDAGTSPHVDQDTTGEHELREDGASIRVITP